MLLSWGFLQAVSSLGCMHKVWIDFAVVVKCAKYQKMMAKILSWFDLKLKYLQCISNTKELTLLYIFLIILCLQLHLVIQTFILLYKGKGLYIFVIKQFFFCHFETDLMNCEIFHSLFLSFLWESPRSDFLFSSCEPF